MAESSAERAASVEQVMTATANETPAVKEAALQVLPPPSPSATDVVWIVLVSGLVVILILALLGLTHVIGTSVSDDKLVTIFTTVLAGLLGMFVKSPTAK
jgi:hypothetical protein